jgi:hypothetical protein
LSVLSNFSHYLDYIFTSEARTTDKQKQLAVFHFDYLIKAVVVVFGTWLLAPLTFVLGLIIFGQMPNKTQIAELYCIWGYSYVFYIIAALVSVLPFKVLPP